MELKEFLIANGAWYKFLVNCKKSNGGYKQKVHISTAFAWDETLEGSNYWYTLANSSNNTSIPKEQLLTEIENFENIKKPSIFKRMKDVC